MSKANSASNSQVHGIPKEAAEAWQKYRSDAFSNRNVVKAWQKTYRRNQSQETTDSSGTITLFSDSKHWYYQSITNDGEKKVVIAANSKYAFHIESHSGSEWSLVSTEVLEKPVGKWSNDHLAIESRKSNPPNIQLRRIFSRVGWLAAPFGVPLEDYVTDNADWFGGSTVRDDPQLGKIVTVAINANLEPSTETREKFGSVRTEVTGSIQFLQDHKWILHHYQIDAAGIDADGNVAGNASSTYSSEVNAELGIPSRSEVKHVKPSGYSLESKSDFQPLSTGECQDCLDKCYLSGFGLPEPPGVSWGWPNWAYGLIGLTCFGLAYFGFRRFSQTTQSI